MQLAIVIDASDVARALGALEANFSDLSEPFTKAGELVFEDARGVIISQGNLFGAGWGPMSPLTHVVATKLYGRGRDPRTLLYDTRGLLDSLQKDGPANIFEVQPLSAEFGSGYTSPRTGFAIAKYQQEGTTRTFRVLQGAGFAEAAGYPGRKFLGWQESRRDQYAGIFAEHLMKDV